MTFPIPSGRIRKQDTCGWTKSLWALVLQDGFNDYGVRRGPGRNFPHSRLVAFSSSFSPAGASSGPRAGEALARTDRALPGSGATA